MKMGTVNLGSVAFPDHRGGQAFPSRRSLCHPQPHPGQPRGVRRGRCGDLLRPGGQPGGGQGEGL